MTDDAAGTLDGSGAVTAGVVTLVATAAAASSAGAYVPGLVAGVAAGVVAGATVFLIRRKQAAVPGALQDAVHANSQLRHDIRGALSPALLVSDRLTGHADPGVVKAGNTVVRAVQRATELLEANKQEDAGRVSPPAR